MRKGWHRNLLTAFLVFGLVAGIAFPAGDVSGNGGGRGVVEAANVSEQTNGSWSAEREWILGLAALYDEGRREQLAARLASYGLTLLDADQQLALVRGAEDQIRRFQDTYPEIFVQPNFTYQLEDNRGASTYRIDRIGPDAMESMQWGLEAIQAKKGWALLQGREMHEVVVAVVDSGVDLNHPDLAEQIWKGEGYNAFAPDKPPLDDHGHGTHVAGVIAATIGNGVGVRGVAGFPAVKIMPIKVMDSQGKGSTYDIARGIAYAVDHGADVINLSIGGREEDTFVRQAVERAIRKGVPVVAASGNEGESVSLSSPANIPEAFTVGAVKQDIQWMPESNYGPELDLVAPGEKILSTYFRDVPDYAYMNGTSAAAPFVSGVLALMKALKPDITVAELERYLLHHTLPLGERDGAGRNDYYGFGLLQMDRVLQALLYDLDNGTSVQPAPEAPIDNGDGIRDSNLAPIAFSDVQATHWAAESIAYVSGKRWFGGFPDGTFKPSQTMKRAQAAAVFARLLDLPPAIPHFQDIDSGHWAAYVIGAVQERGLMTGDRGSFKPNASLTRAQFAKVMVHAFALSLPEDMDAGAGARNDGTSFVDVRPNDWYAPYARIMSGLGLMRGNEEGKFLPNRPITRAEVAVILHRYAMMTGQ